MVTRPRKRSVFTYEESDDSERLMEKRGEVSASHLKMQYLLQLLYTRHQRLARKERATMKSLSVARCLRFA